MIRLKNGGKPSITTPLLAATTVLLIAANVLLGIILIRQSSRSMQSLIRARMLDIANTAASMLDGDTMRDMTAEDIASPKYNEQLRILRTFLDHIELSYIYCIRDEGDKFSFTIDPDPDHPGEFGEEIEYTKALDNAAHGTADVDEEPTEDRWGRFYSAYSPIFDGYGRVAGIVGVDFSAEWYESRTRDHLVAVVIVCTASTLIGIVLAFTVTSRIRRRFNELYDEMNNLSKDFEDLNHLITLDKEDAVAPNTDTEQPSRGRTDEIAMLGDQIRTFQTKLRQYITYVNSQAYTDTMTGVGSKTAYLKKVRHIDKDIAAGRAEFAVVVFDINGLKKVNDNYGHEMGDKLIIETASLIKRIFGAGNIYRIGGDEFIAVLEHSTEDDISTLFARLDGAVAEYNKVCTLPVSISLSKGANVSEADSAGYNQVFKKADEAMYADKAEYYRQRKAQENGDAE